MVATAHRGAHRSAFPSAIWPGFVDALTGLLLVLIFTISTFIIVQFYLRDELTGQDKVIASLQSQIGELSRVLSLERLRSTDLEDRVAELSISIASTREKLAAAQQLAADETSRADELSRSLAVSEETAIALTLDLESAAAEAERVLNLLAAAEAAKAELTEDLETEATLRASVQLALRNAQTVADANQKRIALLNRQIAALRGQLATLQDLLDESERRDAEREVIIKNLGARLNAALAQKVSDLAQYRSEFFGRMREALGNRDDVRIVGDRFVLQSGILFDTASAELGPDGREDLRRIAEALREISPRIPTEIKWLIRVDGHTDQRPLRAGGPHADNWELSQARALAVVRYLVDEQGLPANRFAATGFGPHQPIATGDTPEAHARNRRIELTLTNR